MTADSPILTLRHVPTQARSRQRLADVLDAAETILAAEGAAAFTTNRVAEAAGVPVGSVYRYFADKEAIAEALAMRFWSEFADLVAGVADADELDPLADPGATVLETLAAGFRARPAFLALWYGGLRSARVCEATRRAGPCSAPICHRVWSGDHRAPAPPSPPARVDQARVRRRQPRPACQDSITR